MKSLKVIVVSFLIVLTLTFSFVLFENLVLNTEKTSAWLTTDEVELCILVSKDIHTRRIDEGAFWMCIDYMDAD